MQRKNLFNAISEHIATVVNAIRVIRTPDFQRMPKNSLYSDTKSAIDTIAFFCIYKEHVMNVVEHNGIIVLSAACLASSMLDVVLSCSKAFLCISSAQGGVYNDHILQGGGLKGLLHGIKLGMMKGVSDIIHIAIQCIKSLTTSTVCPLYLFLFLK